MYAREGQMLSSDKETPTDHQVFQETMRRLELYKQTVTATAEITTATTGNDDKGDQTWATTTKAGTNIPITARPQQMLTEPLHPDPLEETRNNHTIVPRAQVAINESGKEVDTMDKDNDRAMIVQELQDAVEAIELVSNAMDAQQQNQMKNATEKATRNNIDNSIGSKTNDNDAMDCVNDQIMAESPINEKSLATIIDGTSTREDNPTS